MTCIGGEGGGTNVQVDRGVSVRRCSRICLSVDSICRSTRGSKNMMNSFSFSSTLPSSFLLATQSHGGYRLDMTILTIQAAYGRWTHD